MRKVDAQVISVDVRDHDAVAEWAKEFCTGLDMHEIATILGTDADARSIAEAVTKSLPDGARQVARRVCEDALTGRSAQV